MHSKRSTWASAVVLAGLLLAACGDDSGTDGGGGEAGASEGEVTISGSSTVAPISAIVADDFNASGSNASITVDDPGTGDGFALFCEGSIDIADASRPINEEEVAACEAAGIEFVELEIAFDGLTVMTHPDNDAVECLSFGDLYALTGPEADGVVESWSDAATVAGELGSGADLPDAPFDMTAPGPESGTYDAFAELALGDPSEARLGAGAITEDQVETIRTDYSSQADDNAIIAGIEGSDSSFGWVGFAFAEGAGDSVKEIAVDGGDGCVEPSIETIADGSYPLSRSLFIYVNAANAEANPAVAEYVDFYLTTDSLGALVEEAGYVPLPEDRASATRETWDSRTTGSAAS